MRTRRRAVRRCTTFAALAAATLVAARCSRPGEARGDRPAAAPQPLAVLPPIRHVFVIVLENASYAATFGPGSAAPYLADTLAREGALLTRYYATGHNSLPNYVALISGLAPARRTRADCPRYDEFVQTGTAPDGQPEGDGCIYPASVPTLANQLEARQLTWKGYMEDMGNDTAREAGRCAHPAIGARDPTQVAEVGDQYAARHDPFVYFHALLDSGSCAAHVAPLTELTADLAAVGSTPNFAFIVPNLCHDGHDQPCVDGESGGLASADRFLAQWVPAIRRAPAFGDGLLIVTTDEADGDGDACCAEQSGPNVRHAGVSGPGGGRVGAVLLSPYIAPGTVSDVPYNHYALLESVEDLFGLPHLGYAGQAGLAPFGADVYTQASGAR